MTKYKSLTSTDNILTKFHQLIRVKAYSSLFLSAAVTSCSQIHVLSKTLIALTMVNITMMN